MKRAHSANSSALFRIPWFTAVEGRERLVTGGFSAVVSDGTLAALKALANNRELTRTVAFVPVLAVLILFVGPLVDQLKLGKSKHDAAEVFVVAGHLEQ